MGFNILLECDFKNIKFDHFYLPLKLLEVKWMKICE